MGAGVVLCPLLLLLSLAIVANGAAIMPTYFMDDEKMNDMMNAAAPQATSPQDSPMEVPQQRKSYRLPRSRLRLYLEPEQKLLLVAIPSAPSNFHRRDTIRKSWYNAVNATFFDSSIVESVEIRFFIAQVSNATIDEKIAEEAREHKDIIRLDSFVDDYYNLTLKTLGMAKYAFNNNFLNMFKCDDDTFLRLDLLIVDLVQRDNTKTLLMGRVKRDVVPHADPKHRWYMRDQFNESVYPTYLAGPGYLLGYNALASLSSWKHNVIYRLEDVAVGIYLRGEPYDFVDMPSDIYSTSCREGSYFINSVEAEEQIELWDNFLQTGSPCKEGWIAHVCVSEPCMCNPLPSGVESCNT